MSHIKLFLILIIIYISPIYALELNSNFEGEATIYYRLSGTSDPYKHKKIQIPSRLELSSGKNYDLKLESYENFFIVRSGEAKNIPSSKALPLQLNTDRKLSVSHLLMSLSPILILIPLLLFMRIGALQKRLSDTQDKITLLSNIPTEIGGYKILKCIGSGGMGELYLAERENGERVAIKKPYMQNGEDEIFIKRFQHEAIIGMGLENRGIVKIFDYSADPKEPFICMEYLEGETLAELLKRSKLTVEEAIHYTLEILKPLQYAHEMNVIHRDIKPTNIMICNNGQLKLMDFGIAKNSSLTALTATDTMLGTPNYTAPEQIDSKNIDARADLYSVGIIMYEMLTGVLPFMDEDPIKVVMQKLRGEVTEISKLLPNLDPKIAEIIMKLISKEPQNRPKSAKILIDELSKI